MKTLAICNNKGGVGKTTCALMFAEIFSEKYRVLLIDLDQQMNATSCTHAKTTGVVSVYDLLMGQAEASEGIQTWEHGDIIPGDSLVVDAEVNLSRLDTPLTMLDDALENIRTNYDFIIIDTSPTLGYVTRNALVAANDTIIVVNSDAASVQGASRICSVVDTVRSNKRLNPHLNVAGILINEFNKRGILDKSTLAQLPSFAESHNTKVFKTQIRRCVKVPQAATKQIPLIDFAPTCTAANDFNDVVYEYVSNL